MTGKINPKRHRIQIIQKCVGFAILPIFVMLILTFISIGETHTGFGLLPVRAAEGINPPIYLPIVINRPGADYKIVFASKMGEHDEGANTEIYLVSANGQNLAQLTHTQSSEEAPDWSPDGSRIVFASDRDGDMEIYSMELDGSDVVQITHNDTLDTDPNWAPDGSQIAYTCSTDEHKLAVCTIRPDGTGFTRLSLQGHQQWSPLWLSCSSRIAYIGEDADFHHHIFLYQPDATEAIQIGDVTTVRKISLSQDTRKIAFLDEDTAMNPHYHLIDTDGSHFGGYPSAILADDIDWSPDGTSFAAVTSFGNDSEIVIFMANDNDFKFMQVVDNDADDFHPRWSPVPLR